MQKTQEYLTTGIAYYRSGRLQDAEQACRHILSVEPNCAEAWHLLGLIAYQLGNTEVAVSGVSGSELMNQGMLDNAIACYQTALVLKPDYPDALNNLGMVLATQGKFDEAEGCYRKALEINPDYAAAQNNLGNILKGKGNLVEAIACYKGALNAKRDYAEAHYNLGLALQELDQLDDAIACYQKALELKPDYADALSNLGLALTKLGRLDAAIAYCRRAAELNPKLEEARNNLGNALMAQGYLDEAADCYRRGIELKPNSAEIHYNLGCLMLLQGNFEQGWPEFEWRWKTDKLKSRHFHKPKWCGQDLNNRRILLHAEQGLGDTIQFVRYSMLIKQMGGTVLVECPKRLEKLLASCPHIDQLISGLDQPPQFDFQSPLLSLPGIVRTTPRTIPSSVPYLFADSTLVEHWRSKLDDIPGFRIGINWKGRQSLRSALKRDIPFDFLAELAQMPNARLISLQQGLGRDDLSRASSQTGIFDPGGDLDTAHGAFMDSAAIMKNLDLVITSDTAIPHLAGALGVPVWLALPFVPDWRWLLDRDDSPWYPTMRLFRQKTAGDWAGVFEEIKSALCGLATSR